MTRSSRIILAAVAAASALAAGAAVPALMARPAATAQAVMPAADAGTTIYACRTSRHTLARVRVNRPPACPAGTVPVHWQGQAGQRVPSPSPRATSPNHSPTATSPSPTTTSPSPSPSPSGTPCTTSDPSGTCGPYSYPLIPNSNGYTTYVSNNCWADPSCQQTITARDPGTWTVRADEPASNTGVKTYPDVQQLFSDWTGGGWNNGPNVTDTPVSGLTRLSSSYAETMPHNSGTDAQAAWDIWLSADSGYPTEVMVWVDNVNRGSGGATLKASVPIGGQDWSLYEYGKGELIWSLGAPGTFAQQGSGTVDLLALLHWMQANGYAATGAAIGQIDFGWEICSTGGSPENFGVSAYSITASP